MNEKTRKNIADIAKKGAVSVDTTELKPNSHYIRGCCVCRAIEIQGFMIRKSNYDLDQLRASGVEITHGFLSKECLDKMEYGIDVSSKDIRETCRAGPVQYRKQN